VVGNDIASYEGFKYSSALDGVAGNWTYDALNQFLYKPRAYVKGTKMVFAGLKKTADRASVIAYLRAQDDSPEPLP
jgi:cytochrome c